MNFEDIKHIKNLDVKIVENYKLYFNRIYNETIKENYKILEGLLGLLNNYNIKVYILITPSLLKHNRNIYTDSQKKFYKEINILKKSYKFNVVDLFEDKDFVESLFKDYTHLNYNGAKLLSRKLNEIISTEGE